MRRLILFALFALLFAIIAGVAFCADTVMVNDGLVISSPTNTDSFYRTNKIVRSTDANPWPSSGGSWGSITGNIAGQTDLTAYVIAVVEANTNDFPTQAVTQAQLAAGITNAAQIAIQIGQTNVDAARVYLLGQIAAAGSNSAAGFGATTNWTLGLVAGATGPLSNRLASTEARIGTNDTRIGVLLTNTVSPGALTAATGAVYGAANAYTDQHAGGGGISASTATNIAGEAASSVSNSLPLGKVMLNGATASKDLSMGGFGILDMTNLYIQSRVLVGFWVTNNWTTEMTEGAAIMAYTGLYVPQGSMHYGRPVYVHSDGPGYLFLDQDPDQGTMGGDSDQHPYWYWILYHTYPSPHDSGNGYQANAAQVWCEGAYSNNKLDALVECAYPNQGGGGSLDGLICWASAVYTTNYVPLWSPGPNGPFSPSGLTNCAYYGDRIGEDRLPFSAITKVVAGRNMAVTNLGTNTIVIGTRGVLTDIFPGANMAVTNNGDGTVTVVASNAGGGSGTDTLMRAQLPAVANTATSALTIANAAFRSPATNNLTMVNYSITALGDVDRSFIAWNGTDLMLSTGTNTTDIGGGGGIVGKLAAAGTPAWRMGPDGNWNFYGHSASNLTVAGMLISNGVAYTAWDGRTVAGGQITASGTVQQAAAALAGAGVLTNPAAFPAALTNGITGWFGGKLNGSNGVYFTDLGTNYWLTHP